MKRKVALLALSLLTLVFFSFYFFSKRSVTKDQLIDYINNPENGLVKTKTLGDLTVELIYKPSDLLIESDPVIDSIRAEIYKKNYYFIVNFSKKGQELEASYVGDARFKELIETLSFNFKNNVKIITDSKEEIIPTDCVYSRMYGSTGKSTLILIFENKELVKAQKFSFKVDYPEIGINNESFEFNGSDIQKVPSLKFKSKVN